MEYILGQWIFLCVQPVALWVNPLEWRRQTIQIDLLRYKQFRTWQVNQLVQKLAKTFLSIIERLEFFLNMVRQLRQVNQLLPNCNINVRMCVNYKRHMCYMVFFFSLPVIAKEKFIATINSPARRILVPHFSIRFVSRVW